MNKDPGKTLLSIDTNVSYYCEHVQSCLCVPDGLADKVSVLACVTL